MFIPKQFCTIHSLPLLDHWTSLDCFPGIIIVTVKLLNTRFKQYSVHLTFNENMPIQIKWKFYHQKNENFQIIDSDIFHISAQNIDCRYWLEPPRTEVFWYGTLSTLSFWNGFPSHNSNKSIDGNRSFRLKTETDWQTVWSLTRRLVTKSFIWI